MSTGKSILAVLAGVAGGVALGLLFAPESGTETRRRIVKKGKHIVDAVNAGIDEKFEDLKNHLACAGKQNTRRTAEEAVQK